MSRLHQVGVLSGSLVAAVHCSSAPVQSAEDVSPVPVVAAEASTCNGIEAPTLIRQVEPYYPASLREQGIKGKVILEGLLEPDGTVVNARVLTSPSDMLTKLAMEAFLQRRYKPARCKDSGSPIRVYVRMTATFS